MSGDGSRPRAPSMDNIVVHAHYFPAARQSLYIRTIDVPHPVGEILFLHASAVHSDFYVPLAIRLAQAKIRVWLPDLRGHGRSFGVRGHIRSFDDYVHDTTRVWHHFRDTAPYPVPTLIGGESLGGLIACIAAQHAIQPDGVFLTSPALALHFDWPPMATRLLWRFQHLVGRVHPLLPLPLRGVTHHPQITDLITRDPLTTRYYTLAFLIQLLHTQHRQLRPEQISCPSLAIFSNEDPIIDAVKSSTLLAETLLNGQIQFEHGAQHSLVADAPDRLVAAFLNWYHQHILVHHGCPPNRA